MFKLDSNYYKAPDFDSFVNNAIDSDTRVVINGYKKIYYYNLPCAFDIETTSVQIDNQKIGLMYIWQFGINGRCIIGRTWSDFRDLLKYISAKLKLNDKKRLIVYVHNLTFEFGFMRTQIKWTDSFFNADVRKPIYALSEYGIEFRCSYVLSGLSLAIVSKNLLKYKVDKLVGELNYDLVRHSKTKMTPREIDYCINDVKVVMAYVQEMIDYYGDISDIPLTNTGKVRKFCREQCLEGKGGLTYKKIIRELQITDVDEYNQLRNAFQGGFTHANSYYVGNVIDDVFSVDITSSYPAVMLTDKYPMSRGRIIDDISDKNIDYYTSRFCCIFDVYFRGLRPKIGFESYIAFWKCQHISRDRLVNNGRVVFADSVMLTITNVDLDIINLCYDYDNMFVSNFRVYDKQYLPTKLIMAMIDLYKAKTQLKGVKGKEQEYLLKKGMLNSLYGMCVTDIIRPKITYDSNTNDWVIKQIDPDKELSNYNHSNNRFLFYAWGIFVTAYARRNLFRAILECGNDYCYSDTDSVKGVNFDKHKKFFEDYNLEIEQKIRLACNYHNINFADVVPDSHKTKILGGWDFEGTYKHFKTLGAKKYMVESSDGDYSFTVAGCNKKTAIPYMLKTFGYDGIFDAFVEGLEIPADYTGKMTHVYIDTVKMGDLKDYQGVVSDFRELSGIYLDKCPFSLKTTVSYIDYLNGYRDQIN